MRFNLGYLNVRRCFHAPQGFLQTGRFRRAGITAVTGAGPIARAGFRKRRGCQAGAALSAEKSHASSGLQKVWVRPGWSGLVTVDNKPFIPFGAMYFKPNTGWTPRFWKEFDAEATRRDLLILKAHNFNTVRLWLTSLSFYPHPGALDSAAIEKFDQFLALAEEAGTHVQVCALTTRQGRPVNEIPAWQRTDVFADPHALEDQEQFWSLFAGRYKGRNVILTYELANEERLADAAVPALAIVLVGIIPVIMISNLISRSRAGHE